MAEASVRRRGTGSPEPRERPATALGQPLATASHRRGISLVELLAAMAAASVVMATAMGLVHTSYRLESRARLVRADEHTALRLARQFRTDVHETHSVAVPRAADGQLITFTGPTGRIDYRALAQGIVRTTQPDTGPTAREEFSFSRPIAWTAEAEGGLVTLRGISAPDGRHPPLAIEAAAAVPRDQASAREEGASP